MSKQSYPTPVFDSVELVRLRQFAASYPGHGLPFTQLTDLLTTTLFGANPKPLIHGQPKLSSTCKELVLPHLGSLGRFGNQILQYGFGRLLANKFNANFIHPLWAGSNIFQDALAPMATAVGYDIKSESIDADNTPIDIIFQKCIDEVRISLTGYFGMFSKLFQNSAEEFRGHFKYRDLIHQALLESLCKDKLAPGAYAAVHIRRGDFIGQAHLETPLGQFSAAISLLRNLKPKLPIVYLSDQEGLQSTFLAIDPNRVTISPFIDVDLQFLYDFFLLQNASVIILSPNSTFSMTAAMLSNSVELTILPAPNFPRLVDNWTFNIKEA